MKLFLKSIKVIFFLLVLAVLVFLLGPKPDFPVYDSKITPLALDLHKLEDYVLEKEAAIDNLKPFNQARIIWADSVRQTTWSVVYLHGFSASPMESDPVHLDFAQRYGCNLYLARLAGHGIDNDNSFSGINPGDWVASAKEAIAIGNLLGEKVIVMSCSTGSTLSIYLTSGNPTLVDAQILFSPNIAINDPGAAMMTGPWGAQLARQLIGTHRHVASLKGWEAENYWTTSYDINGLIAMQSLLDHCMQKEVFEEIQSPYCIGYYYKNEEEKDQIISTEAILSFNTSTATPDSLKRCVALAGVKAHVLASRMQSKQLDTVAQLINDFAEQILGMKAVEKKEAVITPFSVE